MDSWHNLRTKRKNNKRERLRWCQVNKKIEADEINSMTAHLANLQMELGVSNQEEIHKQKLVVNDLMGVEELKWKQRAKEHWLKDGDQNTKYFYACVKQRRKANQIFIVVDADGVLCNSAKIVE
jgi:hypothetical protein